MNKVRKFPYSNIKRLPYHNSYIYLARDFSIVYLEHGREEAWGAGRFLHSLPRAQSRGEGHGKFDFFYPYLGKTKRRRKIYFSYIFLKLFRASECLFLMVFADRFNISPIFLSERFSQYLSFIIMTSFLSNLFILS